MFTKAQVLKICLEANKSGVSEFARETGYTPQYIYISLKKPGVYPGIENLIDAYIERHIENVIDSLDKFRSAVAA